MSDKFDKFTERARKVLTLAQEEAQRFNHNYIGTEHLLLGLVREGDGVAARVLSNMGVQLPKVRSAVEFIIGRGEVEIVVLDDEGHERIVNTLREGDSFGEISFLHRTPRTATVRAQTNVEVHILRRLDFDALLERLGSNTLDHLEDTAKARIEDTRQKLAAVSGGAD